jgi:hypothetical protein
VSSDKKEKAEQALVAYQKLYANTDLLAELLCEPMPQLPIDDVMKKDEDTVNVDMYTPSGRFEDVC